MQKFDVKLLFLLTSIHPQARYSELAVCGACMHVCVCMRVGTCPGEGGVEECVVNTCIVEVTCGIDMRG